MGGPVWASSARTAWPRPRRRSRRARRVRSRLMQRGRGAGLEVAHLNGLGAAALGEQQQRDAGVEQAVATLRRPRRPVRSTGNALKNSAARGLRHQRSRRSSRRRRSRRRSAHLPRQRAEAQRGSGGGMVGTGRTAGTVSRRAPTQYGHGGQSPDQRFQQPPLRHEPRTGGHRRRCSGFGGTPPSLSVHLLDTCWSGFCQPRSSLLDRPERTSGVAHYPPSPGSGSRQTTPADGDPFRSAAIRPRRLGPRQAHPRFADGPRPLVIGR